MKKENENLPEAQSAKKNNNKMTIICIVVALLGLISASGTGAIPMLAAIAGIVIGVIYLTKYFKARKK